MSAGNLNASHFAAQLLSRLILCLFFSLSQCVLFGTFMIWFASITINLGPTFLSGALAANTESGHNAPSCPLVHGPFRHYILNALWIVINIICVALTLFHLRKLHRDLTKANVEAVRERWVAANCTLKFHESSPVFLYRNFYLQVRVAGLVTTLVNVTGGRQGATNALASEDGAVDTRNGTTPKVRVVIFIMLIVSAKILFKRSLLS